MKMTLLFLITLFTTTLAYAQDTNEKETNDSRQEVTLLFRDFDDIGIGYRFGSESSLWRLSLTGGAVTGETEADDTSIYVNKQSRISIDLGREYRFEVAKNLSLRIGGDVFYDYRWHRQENEINNDTQSINVNSARGYGVKIVTGLMFQATDRIHLGFELLPTFSNSTSERTSISIYDNNRTEFTDTSSNYFAFNLDNSSLRFNVGFNF